MNAAQTAPQQAAPKCPPDTFWFGLHRRNSGGAWERCERPEWGNASKWWPITDVDPVAMAEQGFGPGIFRILWRGEDRRRHRGYSDPFVVHPSAQAPAAPEANGLAPAAPLAELQHPTHPTAMDPAHPVALFYALHQVYRDDRSAERERDIHMWTMMLETQRANAQMSLAQNQQFNEIMLRASDNLRTERTEVDRERYAASERRVLQQLSALAAQVQAGRQSDDDDLEDDDEQRAGGALQNGAATPGAQFLAAVTEVLNGPLGKVIADVAAKKFGLAASNPALPERDAAE